MDGKAEKPTACFENEVTALSKFCGLEMWKWLISKEVFSRDLKEFIGLKRSEVVARHTHKL